MPTPSQVPPNCPTSKHPPKCPLHCPTPYPSPVSSCCGPRCGGCCSSGCGDCCLSHTEPVSSTSWAPEPLLLWMCVLGGLQVLWWLWGLLQTLTRPQETPKKGTIRMRGQRTYCSLKFYPLLSYLSFLDPHQLNKQKICLSKAIRVMPWILYSVGLMLVSIFLRLLEKF